MPSPASTKPKPSPTSLQLAAVNGDQVAGFVDDADRLPTVNGTFAQCRNQRSTLVISAGNDARDRATRHRVEHVAAPRRLVIGVEHQAQFMF